MLTILIVNKDLNEILDTLQNVRWNHRGVQSIIVQTLKSVHLQVLRGLGGYWNDKNKG